MKPGAEEEGAERNKPTKATNRTKWRWREYLLGPILACRTTAKLWMSCECSLAKAKELIFDFRSAK